MRKPIKTSKHNSCVCECPTKKERKPRGRSRVSRVEKIGDFRIPFTQVYTETYTDPIVKPIVNAANRADTYVAGKIQDVKDNIDDRIRESGRRAAIAKINAANAQKIEDARRLAEKAKYEHDRIDYDAWQKKSVFTRQKEKNAGVYADPNWREPSEPTPPPISVKEEWGKAKDSTKRWIKQAATPAGIFNVAKGVAGEAYKGMEWLEEKRVHALNEQIAQNHRRMKNWRKLPKETRQELLNEQYEKEYYANKIRKMKDDMATSQANATDAWLTGRTNDEVIYKVDGETDIFGRETKPKYFNQYGREVPGERVTTPRSSRPKRTENQDLNSIFGFSQGGPVTNIPSPLSEPRMHQSSYEGEQMGRRQPRYSDGAGVPLPRPPRVRQISARAEMDSINNLLY